MPSQLQFSHTVNLCPGHSWPALDSKVGTSDASIPVERPTEGHMPIPLVQLAVDIFFDDVSSLPHAFPNIKDALPGIHISSATLLRKPAGPHRAPSFLLRNTL